MFQKRAHKRISKHLAISSRSGTQSVAQVTRELMELIKDALWSVIIMSGTMRSSVYCDDGLISAMEEARERGVFFRFIVGPEPDLNTLRRLKAFWNSLFVTDKRPAQHFAVIDGRAVRYEKFHPDVEGVRVNTILKNAPLSAGELVKISEESMSSKERVTLKVETWMRKVKGEQWMQEKGFVID